MADALKSAGLTLTINGDEYTAVLLFVPFQRILAVWVLSVIIGYLAGLVSTISFILAITCALTSALPEIRSNNLKYREFPNLRHLLISPL
ncbi:hypothetical protein D3C85_1201840 [compost metagenome]